MAETSNKQNYESELRILESHPSNVLLRLGLSPNQTRVYLCLSKTGPKSASQISQILNIPRTEIYALLKRLQQKRCVIAKHGRPWRFKSVSIEQFFEKKIESEYKKIKELEGLLIMIRNLKLENSAMNSQFVV